ncbi:MAG TPA: hypothetical protein VM204_01365 [Gaiellaceae bacterium]|nr:hypothetical protein [Gaiellaceae bacterium]
MGARTRQRWRRGLGALAFAAAWCLEPVAQADPKDDAAEAYDKGAAAYDKGDFAVAATQLARADEIAPSAVTLELALGAALRADDAALGMTLVERVEKRRGTKALDRLADAARRRLASRVGKLGVTCPRAPRCDVTLDGERFEPGAPRYVAVGAREVSVALGAAPQRFDVTIEPGKTVELVPTAPAVAASSPAAPAAGGAETPPRGPDEAADVRVTSGLSPTWFWLGVGLTAVAGGAAAADAGRSAEQRTVVLLAGAGALALATGALGLFFVDWSGGRGSGAASSPVTRAGSPRVDVAIGPGAARVVLGAAF